MRHDVATWEVRIGSRLDAPRGKRLCPATLPERAVYIFERRALNYAERAAIETASDTGITRPIVISVERLPSPRRHDT